MEEGKKKRAFGVTFSGDVTFHGPMFDIHDNEHIHLCVEKLPCEAQTDELMEMATDITQPPQEEELNYFQPQLHLKRLFVMEWFEICRTKAEYTQAWGEGIVDVLMESKWRDNIARDWSKIYVTDAFDARHVHSTRFSGVVMLGVAQINRNTRTFSKYMSRAKKEPYYGWLLDYVKHSLNSN